jgi:hypothetical protein
MNRNFSQDCTADRFVSKAPVERPPPLTAVTT